MSILKEKVINKYSLNQLKEILPQKILYYFMDNKTLVIPPLYTISQYIDLDYINYTPSDLKKDYKKYDNYKEIETVFNIFKQGYSVNECLIKSKVDQDFILKLKALCQIVLVEKTNKFSSNSSDFRWSYFVANKLLLIKILALK